MFNFTGVQKQADCGTSHVSAKAIAAAKPTKKKKMEKGAFLGKAIATVKKSLGIGKKIAPVIPKKNIYPPGWVQSTGAQSHLLSTRQIKALSTQDLYNAAAKSSKTLSKPGAPAHMLSTKDQISQAKDLLK